MQRSDLEKSSEIMQDIESARSILAQENPNLEELALTRSILNDHHTLLFDLLKEKMQLHDLELFNKNGNLVVFLKQPSDIEMINQILEQVKALYAEIYACNRKFFSEHPFSLKDKTITPELMSSITQTFFADKKTKLHTEKQGIENTFTSLYELLKDIFSTVDSKRILMMQDELRVLMAQTDSVISDIKQRQSPTTTDKQPGRG